MRKIFLLLILLNILIFTDLYSQISEKNEAECFVSVAGGGEWHNDSTWQNGKIPSINDKVCIKSDVKINRNAECKALRIEKSGILRKADFHENCLLVVNNDIENKGVITNNTKFKFSIKCIGRLKNEGKIVSDIKIRLEGNLENSGTIENRIIVLSGNRTQFFSFARESMFSPDTLLCEDYGSELFAKSAICFHEVFADFGGRKLILRKDASFCLKNSCLKNVKMEGDNVKVPFVCRNTHVENIHVKNISIQGNCSIDKQMFLLDNTVLEDTISDSKAKNKKKLVLFKDFTNNGVIHKTGKHMFQANVSGNLVNNGIWNIDKTVLSSSSNQKIHCKNNTVIQSKKIIKQSHSKLIVEKTLHLKCDTFDVNEGHIEIPANAKLEISEGCISNAIIQCLHSAAALKFHDKATITNSLLFNANLYGKLLISPNVIFRGTTTIHDTLSKKNANDDCLVTINNTFINKGNITNASKQLKLLLVGDFFNQGIVEKNVCLELKGNIENSSKFEPAKIVFSGGDKQVVRFQNNDTLKCDSLFSKNKAGIEIASKLICKDVNLDFYDNPLLMKARVLKLYNTKLQNLRLSTVDPKTEIHFCAGSRIADVRLMNLTICRKCIVEGNAAFEKQIILKDTLCESLKNLRHKLTLNGLFTNQGEIVEVSPYHLQINCFGDIHNSGNIAVNSLKFCGDAEQKIVNDKNCIWNIDSVKSSNVKGIVSFETDVRFKNSVINFENNKIKLNNNARFTLIHTRLENTQITSSSINCTVCFQDSSTFEYSTVQNLSLAGNIWLKTGNVFKQKVINQGIISKFGYHSHVVLRINGIFENHGKLLNKTLFPIRIDSGKDSYILNYGKIPLSNVIYNIEVRKKKKEQ